MRYFIDTEFIEDGRTIDLISIGIVAADGREYYAEAPVDLSRANEWVFENVVPHLMGVVTSRRTIASEIQRFVTGSRPEFWAYCGAYDWVVLNQLYGPMVDHPKSWPFYCNDIRQEALSRGIRHDDFPEQDTDEHHALADARWNRDVFQWMQGQVH